MKRETLTDPKRFRKRLRQKSNMAAKYVSYELELESAPTFPDRVYVESTNVCNLDCIMCPTGLHIDTRPKGYMEWDLYTAIIDEIAPFAEAVVLHSWGEPLLHKRIIDMIRYAKERDLWVETSTNATRLDEETSRKLIESGLDRVYLSMDGLTKETYEKVRVKGNFEVVLGNIERFLDLNHELGSPVEADIQIVRLSETDAEVEEFVKQWKSSYADLINIKELDTWGGQIDEVNSLAVEQDPDDPNVRPQALPEPLVPRPHPLGRRARLVLARLRRRHPARQRPERRRAEDVARRADAADAPLAHRGQLLRDPVRGLHRVVVVEPRAVRGGGTGGKTEKVRTEESIHAEHEANGKLLPVLNNGGSGALASQGG